MEEVQIVFRNGFGVRESGRLRREKMRLVAKERAVKRAGVDDGEGGSETVAGDDASVKEV